MLRPYPHVLRPYHQHPHQQRRKRRSRTSSARVFVHVPRRAQHPQDLLDLGAQLRGVAEAARAVAGRTQPVAQPFHMVGDGAIHAGRAQCLRQSIAVAREGIGDMTRQHREEFALEPAQRRELWTSHSRHRRRGRLAMPAPPC